jgi:hypothetical protein
MILRINLTLIFLLTISIVLGQNSYDTFIQNHGCRANEYLESLFKKQDLVIICEREHPEMSQYDFFLKIVKEKWFINNVGVIICEVPTRSIQQELDSYLTSENLSKEEANERLKHIYRNIDTGVLWTKTNLYYFIEKVYELNQGLPLIDKIRIIGADMEFSWQNIKTREKYLAQRQTLNARDERMAEFILEWHSTALKNNRKSKALIIMNYRHAYGNKYWTSNGKYEADNVAKYIKESLPKNSTNIYLNGFAYSRIFSFKKPHAKGKWDKAFATNGNKPIGFCLQDSPFGQDEFDHYPYIKTGLLWKDVFDHVIFYNSTKEFTNSFGIKGLVDKDFEIELKRRYEIAEIKFSKKKVKQINTETIN